MDNFVYCVACELLEDWGRIVEEIEFLFNKEMPLEGFSLNLPGLLSGVSNVRDSRDLRDLDDFKGFKGLIVFKGFEGLADFGIFESSLFSERNLD